MQSVSTRIPYEWLGLFNSETVAALARDFVRSPYPLRPDYPGQLDAQTSVSLPERLVLLLRGITGESAAASLRRIFCTQFDGLTAPATKTPLPAAREGSHSALYPADREGTSLNASQASAVLRPAQLIERPALVREKEWRDGAWRWPGESAPSAVPTFEDSPHYDGGATMRTEAVTGWRSIPLSVWIGLIGIAVFMFLVVWAARKFATRVDAETGPIFEDW